MLIWENFQHFSFFMLDFPPFSDYITTVSVIKPGITDTVKFIFELFYSGHSPFSDFQ